jgi:hypothetical protein
MVTAIVGRAIIGLPIVGVHGNCNSRTETRRSGFVEVR